MKIAPAPGPLLREGDVGRVFEQIGEVDDVELRQRVAAERLDGQRHLLDALVAALRGHDDVAIAGRRRRIGLHGGRGRGGIGRRCCGAAYAEQGDRGTGDKIVGLHDYAPQGRAVNSAAPSLEYLPSSNGVVAISQSYQGDLVVSCHGSEMICRQGEWNRSCALPGVRLSFHVLSDRAVTTFVFRPFNMLTRCSISLNMIPVADSSGPCLPQHARVACRGSVRGMAGRSTFSRGGCVARRSV